MYVCICNYAYSSGAEQGRGTFAEVSDGLLDGAPRLVGVGNVAGEDEDVRRAALQGGGGHGLERLLPPRHQRKARPFLGVLVSELLSFVQSSMHACFISFHLYIQNILIDSIFFICLLTLLATDIVKDQKLVNSTCVT